jgi:HEAT repeat protein
MRHAAAFAAGGIGAEEAIQPLRRLAITDPDREVQLAAIRGLAEIGGAAAAVALKSVLYEGSDDLREALEEAISEAEFYDDPLNFAR